MNDFPSIPCFKAYDIRGKVPQDLNPGLAEHIGRALVDFLGAKKIVIGYDIRPSSRDLFEAAARGINAAGADTVCIGLCGTEMVYFATSHLEADGGIMITASHNPPEYNGMKMVRGGSRPISSDTGLKEIEKAVATFTFKESDRTGSVEETGVMDAYIEKLLTYIDLQKLDPLKVVVNAGNGCAGPIIDRLEPHLPVEFIKVHHEPDAAFPNGVPNPMIIENRRSTIDAVKKHGAHLGVAFDGDFDRCFFFDENGSYIEGYYIVGFLAQTILQKNQGAKVVYDPRLIWNTIELAKSAGGGAIQSRSGHSFIKEVMRGEDAVYGGEMSCHHYFKDFYFCDSGMIPMLLLLEILSTLKKPFSTLVAERIQRFPVSGEINNTVENPDAIIQKIQKYYTTQNPKEDFTDGISYEFDNWRFNLRKSNTEPILRLNVEARENIDLMKAKTKELLAMIRA